MKRTTKTRKSVTLGAAQLGAVTLGAALVAAPAAWAEGAEALPAAAARHAFLTAKQRYVRLAVERNALRKEAAAARRTLLEGLLAKVDRAAVLATEQQRELAQQQAAARERFRASIAKVDEPLSERAIGPESRYAAREGDMSAAIERLRRAIASHRMNDAPTIDGETVTKGDYVRHLIAAAEGDLALLSMEDEMLGFMARLAALDARELAEAESDPELVDSGRPEPVDALSAVEFFTGG